MDYLKNAEFTKNSKRPATRYCRRHCRYWTRKKNTHLNLSIWTANDFRNRPKFISNNNNNNLNFRFDDLFFFFFFFLCLFISRVHLHWLLKHGTIATKRLHDHRVSFLQFFRFLFIFLSTPDSTVTLSAEIYFCLSPSSWFYDIFFLSTFTTSTGSFFSIVNFQAWFYYIYYVLFVCSGFFFFFFLLL